MGKVQGFFSERGHYYCKTQNFGTLSANPKNLGPLFVQNVSQIGSLRPHILLGQTVAVPLASEWCSNVAIILQLDH